MSDGSAPDVPDDSSFGAWSAAFWGVVVLFGLGMFLWDFGNVTLAAVPEGQPIGVIHDLRLLLTIIAMLGGGATVAIIGYVVYRYSNPNRGSPATMEPGEGRYTVSMYTVGVVFLMLMTVFMGAGALAQTDEAQNPVQQVDTTRELSMDVVAGQWFWRFEVDGMPVAQGNRVVLPADTVIHFSITSADVIHSFAIQELGVKKDAVPGQQNRGWFYVEHVEGETTIQAGDHSIPADTYQVNCAELCGKGHSQMVGQVAFVSPEDYETWVEANGGSVPESFHEEASGGHGSESEGGH